MSLNAVFCSAVIGVDDSSVAMIGCGCHFGPGVGLCGQRMRGQGRVWKSGSQSGFDVEVVQELSAVGCPCDEGSPIGCSFESHLGGHRVPVARPVFPLLRKRKSTEVAA